MTAPKKRHHYRFAILSIGLGLFALAAYGGYLDEHRAKAACAASNMRYVEIERRNYCIASDATIIPWYKAPNLGR